jgi:hypothetical protein
MPQQGKSIDTSKRQAGATETGNYQGAPRPQSEVRAWAPPTSFTVEARRSTRDIRSLPVPSVAQVVKPTCRALPELCAPVEQ